MTKKKHEMKYADACKQETSNIAIYFGQEFAAFDILKTIPSN